MKIGFTGTRNGMTEKQKLQLRSILLNSRPVEVHHGDCVGADAEFHHMCFGYDLFIVVHPPLDEKRRAGLKGDQERRPKPYLQRNHDIVDETDILIAAPATATEQLRSGTWATVRYAWSQKKSITIIKPDGSILGMDPEKEENK